ncbi:hypothetical protein C0992_010400 [Termitomyces sp. T32_za158]|nr:hypothetical protein C0992_010400 [Termitomyces sp. T32_za158]
MSVSIPWIRLLPTFLCALNATPAFGKLTWGTTEFLFAFGDSYTTDGFNISAGVDSPVPGFTSSNGPNWVNFLGGTYNQTDIKIFDLASGGATIDGTLVPPFMPTVLSIVDQVSQFKQILATKPAGARWDSSNSLFAFWIGINDIGNSFGWSNITGHEPAFYTKLLSRLETQLEILYGEGARSFLFLTVPPTNRAPLFLQQGSKVVTRLHSLITNYNAQLATLVKNFGTKHKDLDQVTVFDTQPIFNTLLDNANALGFVNATGFCDAYQNGTPEKTTQIKPCAPVSSYLTFDEILGFFEGAPSVLTADERYHTTSNTTRKPGQFDKHLHNCLRLKRVAKLPGLLEDLLNNAMHALSSYEKDLPVPNTRFPFVQDVILTSKTHRRDIHKEIDVQTAYETGVADFCATVAATLEFQLSEWSPNCLQWSAARLCNKDIPGVRRDQALADGFLNMSEKGSKRHLVHSTPRERLILDTFPVIAIWEFKNLNFDTSMGQGSLKARADIFHEMLNGFLDSVFPWKECEKGDNCAVVHWKIGTSACPMGNNAVHSSCQSYDNARKLGLSLPERPPTGYESGSKHSARDILQQAWTEALVHDCTFLVINAGNVEIIGMRDRLTQTLYLSDVFLVNDSRYPYFQLHTGLYVSAIRDAQDRAESIVLRKEIPDTWYLRSGLDCDKIMDLSQPEFKVKKVSANMRISQCTD